MWTKQQKLYQLNLLEKIDFWHVHPKIIVFSPASWMCIVGMSIWSKHSSKFMSQTTLVCLHHVQLNTFSSLKTKTCSFSLKTFRTIFWNENRLCVGKKTLPWSSFAKVIVLKCFFNNLFQQSCPTSSALIHRFQASFFGVLCSFVSTKKQTKQSAYLTPWKFFTTSPLKNDQNPKIRKGDRLVFILPSLQPSLTQGFQNSLWKNFRNVTDTPESLPPTKFQWLCCFLSSKVKHLNFDQKHPFKAVDGNQKSQGFTTTVWIYIYIYKTFVNGINYQKHTG